MARKATTDGARAAQVWGELAATALVLGETAWAAQVVVSLRMTRLAGVLADPKTAGDPEFRTMVWEKLQAATNANLAMAEGVRVVHDGLWDWGSRQWEAAEEAWLKLLFTTDATKAADIQTRFAEASLNAAETACNHMFLAASRLGGLGLAPIHKAASANAKRLAREARLPLLAG